MIKSVIHDLPTNSVEATWVDDEGVQVKCHSYADVQMDMLEADLGEDAATYADLIATVKAGIKPPVPQPVVIPQVISMRQARLALLSKGLLDDVEAAINSQAEPLKSVIRIEWDYATEVNRQWPTLIALAPALGLSELELDQLFIEGAEL